MKLFKSFRFLLLPYYPQTINCNKILLIFFNKKKIETNIDI